jgi:hypothetical protein
MILFLVVQKWMPDQPAWVWEKKAAGKPVFF